MFKMYISLWQREVKPDVDRQITAIMMTNTQTVFPVHKAFSKYLTCLTHLIFATTS
jgi:hypothetical protein